MHHPGTNNKVYKKINDSFDWSSDNFKKISEILKKYPPNRIQSAVIPLLDLAQRQNSGWMSKNSIEKVAETLSRSYIMVLEVATFYSMFNLEPIGKNFVQICRTTPCWLRGSENLSKVAEEVCETKIGSTSSDNRFTVVEVECLGACCNAPMVQINDNYYEDLDKEKTLKILNQILKGETPKPGSYRGRINNEPENNRKTLMDIKNA